MVMIKETWKPIKGCDDYFISNTGKVKSFRRKKTLILTPGTCGKGYQFVNLYTVNNNRIIGKIHRLVAIHFISNPENKPQVNHIDLNKKNNHVSNLEWVTQKENSIHAHKLMPHLNRGINNANSLLNKELVKKIIQLHKSGKNRHEIAEIIEVNHYTVLNVILGVTWSHITGIKHTPNRKFLKKEEILSIVDMYNTEKDRKKIAQKFNISPHTVWNIISGKSWSRLTGITYQDK